MIKKGVLDMLERTYWILFVIAGLMVACRMLWDYWLRSQVQMTPEEMSGLTFMEKAAFAFERFCSMISHATGFRKRRMEEKFGKQKLL